VAQDSSGRSPDPADAVRRAFEALSSLESPENGPIGVADEQQIINEAMGDAREAYGLYRDGAVHAVDAQLNGVSMAGCTPGG
jgi:hypothetical protein